MSFIKGAIGGFAVSTLVLAMNIYGGSDNEATLTVIKFLAAPATYISYHYKIADNLMPFVYFGYWILGGAIIGFMLGKGIIGKVATILALIGIVYGHYYTLTLIGDRVVPSLKVFANIF